MGTVASAAGRTLAHTFGRHQDRHKGVNILMVGLDAAGKTTILYRLEAGEVVTTIPTIGFNVETVTYKGANITSWDVGGKDKIRPLWRHYYQNTNALVFVVDSSDKERIVPRWQGWGGAEDELKTMLSADELKGVPLLVFANKRDLPNALTAEEVWDCLQLRSVIDRPVRLQGCVAKTGAGLHDGLEWLSHTVRGTSAGSNTLHADERQVTNERISQTTSLPDVLVVLIARYLVFGSFRECPD